MTNPATPSGHLSLGEYAAHRAELGLVGQSKTMVSKKIKAGVLVKSVVRDHNGHPKIANAELADREWAAGTDYTKAPTVVKEASSSAPRRARLAPPEPAPSADGDPLAPGPIPPPAPSGSPSVSAMDEVQEPDDLSLTREAAREKFWKAHQAEMEFRKRAKELVEAKEVDGKLVELFSSCRNKLRGIPSRARQEDPTLTPVQIAIFEKLIHEALVDLSSAAPPEEGAESAGAGP